ncbi:hypothetical protein SPBR_01911 [Sporothrix brasiliensis 5110]|uniref:Protein kinase domain-containing protein n=1 Tax=Sporothrix brasiliensis 5110 TaxID=1398154 RepID=A0A0C2IPQ9_9PEZI|nr:uncharacterized protein SPBR_01911 [Sporothrix brasiliensis 5110]KIH91016.1 hypothetical protein SPBR_01911 [Sporothrix brasiliensis 5110]
MAYQAVKAMNYLHINGICHGESGDDLPLSSPRYLTYAVDLFRLGGEYLTDQICVVDFGEAFRVSAPPIFSCIPESYISPELLLQMLQDEKNHYGADDEDDDEENDGDDTTSDDPEEGRVTIGPACDLWALGCTLYAIRQQMALFYMIDDPDELVAEMVRFFGKLPPQWWDTWDRRAEYFDDQGKWVRHGGNETYSLEFILSRPRTIVRKPGHESQRTILMTPEAEQKLMADLLYKLLQYEPEKRISATDVLAHEWFRM